MLKRFISFIEENSLFQPEEEILLAVSGGVDSIVMTELFREAGYRFAIAHVNFGLRTPESDQDEAFVQELARQNQVAFFVKHFDTMLYAKNHKLSIQMAARQLRYDWFSELCQAEGFSATATAHHLDDQAETFIINLLRGTGISGLHGILPRQHNLVRPLLFATRNEILEFATQKQLTWRSDSSNQSRKYLRNRIRMDVLPAFQSIDGSFSNTLSQTIHHLRDSESILSQTIASTASSLITRDGNTDYIAIEGLLKLYPLKTWLLGLLQPYNFTFPVVEKIVASLDSIPGRKFYSPTHRLIRDRENLIIQPIAAKGELTVSPESYPINRGTKHFKQEIELSFFETQDIDSLNLNLPLSASLDAGKLQFPLRLRRWQQGDFFVPLGVGGKKKLSDFLIDNKLSLAEKEEVWVLLSGDEIVWVVGWRIDHRYRITAATREALQVLLIR